jgi:hypothetical protein
VRAIGGRERGGKTSNPVIIIVGRDRLIIVGSGSNDNNYYRDDRVQKSAL